MNNQPKKQHGGARSGAGAKPKPPGEKPQQVHYYFHPSTVAALNKKPKRTRARFVEAAVRMALDLPPLPGPDYLAVKDDQ